MHVIKKTNKEVQTTHEIMIVHDGRVVSETNVEGKDDRKLNLGNSSQTHYSKAAGDVRFTVFGPRGIYRNLEKARNVIRITLVSDSTSSLQHNDTM
jgi:hypothetical protein